VLARRGPGALLVGLLGMGPLLFAGSVWAAGLHVYDSRNLLALAPFAALTAAAALAALPVTLVRSAAVALAAVAAVGWVAQAQLPVSATPSIARQLVAEGWRAGTPIAIFGNAFNLRAPLEWYLPHNPTLVFSYATSRPCSSVFVVARRASRLPRSDVESERRVGRFTVVRLRGASRRLQLLQRATLLVSGPHAPPCVRVSHNPRLAPLA